MDIMKKIGLAVLVGGVVSVASKAGMKTIGILIGEGIDALGSIELDDLIG